jgi:hypothetical protein
MGNVILNLSLESQRAEDSRTHEKHSTPTGIVGWLILCY